MSALPQYVYLEMEEAQEVPVAPEEGQRRPPEDQVALWIGGALMFGIFVLMLWLGLP